MRRERDRAERLACREREQHRHLISTPASLTHAHASARQPLDLIGVRRPVVEQRRQ